MTLGVEEASGQGQVCAVCGRHPSSAELQTDPRREYASFAAAARRELANKIDFKGKFVSRCKELHFEIKSESTNPEKVTAINIYTSKQRAPRYLKHKLKMERRHRQFNKDSWRCYYLTLTSGWNN